VTTCKIAVGLGDHWSEPFKQLPSGGANTLPHRRKALVPHVERRRDRAGHSSTGLLQQCVALPQHLVEVGKVVSRLRVDRLEHRVEVVAPVLRRSFDEVEVFRREHRGPQVLQQVACATRALAVGLDPVAALARDLRFNQGLPPVLVPDRPPDDRHASPCTNECFGSDATETACRRQIGDGLHKARLALSIVARDDSDPFGKPDRR
jgi:hypothetical protein